MKQIIIFGSYHGGNKGDEAILFSLLRQIYSLERKIKVVVPSNNPLYIKNNYAVDSIKVNDVTKIFYGVYKSDVTIIGGGGLFFDYQFFDTIMLKKTQILYWIFIIFLSKVLKKKIMIYGVGVGPLNSWVVKKLLILAFSTVDIVTVRDNYSKNLLTSSGLKKIVHVTSDPVFSLDMSLKKTVTQNKYIVITIRSWNEKIDNELIEIMSRFCDYSINSTYNIVIIPMNIQKDLKISNSLLSKIKSEKASIFDYDKIYSLFSVISEANMVIGMRMHSLIFATLVGIPVIALSYNTPKVTEFMNQIDISKFCFDIEKITFDKLIIAFDEIIAERDKLSVHITKKVKLLQRMEKKNVELLEALLFEDNDIQKNNFMDHPICY